MRLFQSVSVYNAESSKWVDRYFIDNIETDSELYFFELDREERLEAEKLEEELEKVDCCGDCDICEGNIEPSLDDLIDIYVERIRDVSPCPCCIKEALEEFVDEILDYIED